MGADASGSISIGVWSDTYANYPPTIADELFAATITTAVKSQVTGLNSGNGFAVAAGNWVRFSVKSVTTIKHVDLTLTCTRAL